VIGIKNICVHIPETVIDNMAKTAKFNLTADFIEKKIGVVNVPRKHAGQTASDLCVLAYQKLMEEDKSLKPNRIDFLCVCTQNGDFQLPQTSSIVQGKLDLPGNCAVFDIGLGCSGYVYALHIAKNFMQMNGKKLGLLFTSDPYSDIIDPEDKNTALIFGDGATVTLLSENPIFHIGKAVFFTDGKKYNLIIKRKNDYFYMNGRSVFDFVMKRVPQSIEQCLKINQLKIELIDIFLLHQGSKYLVKNLAKRSKLDLEKVPINLRNIGNTVSSSIPILLKNYIKDQNAKTILLSGFGIGLSVASTIIRRVPI